MLFGPWQHLYKCVASYGDDFIMSNTCMCDFFDPFVKNAVLGLVLIFHTASFILQFSQLYMH